MADNAMDNVRVWHELMSRDPERAKTFYGQVAGLATAPLEGVPWPYTLWLHGDRAIGGLIPPVEGQEGWPSGSEPHWVSSFVIADVDAAVQKAQELGGQVVVPPVDIPGFGRAAVLRDPEGAVFGVFQADT